MVKDAILPRFAPAAAALGVVALIVLSKPLGAVPRGIAIGCVIASWSAAALLQHRAVRAHATVVLALASATAAGQVEAGVLYGVACAMLILACVASLRAARMPASTEDTASATPARSTIVLFATAITVASGLILGLPRLAEIFERRLNAMFGGADNIEATAFSTTMVLGATRGMLQSKAIVLRIEGGRPDYLRGAVYDRYDGTRWTTSGPGRELTRIKARAIVEPGGMRITLVRNAPNGDDMRWFLPPDACDLGVAAGTIEVDGYGVARRAPMADPATITFRTTSCSAPPSPVTTPSPTDLEVSSKVRPALEVLATHWTANAATDRQKLDAIGRELAHFEYSLATPRDEGVDPIVDFVAVHRAGHCEMFASAMALMARTLGIPARVVGGYRVSEVNPITKTAVVRDRNAHAWVEAWVDGAWRAWDPTPLSETFASSGTTMDHVGDLFSAGFDLVVLGLSRLDALGLIGVLTAIVGLLLGLRWLATRLHTRRRQRRLARTLDVPLPCFESMTEALANAGHEHDPAEPIEVFVRRIDATGAPWAASVSRALMHYARLRYGGEGDDESITKEMARAEREIHASRVRT